MLEEVTVVADDDDGAQPFREHALEPQDAFHVQVVGRLVHQEHIGPGGQRLRDRQALLPAAGQRVDLRAPVGKTGQAQRSRDTAGPLALVRSRQRRGDDLLDEDASRQDRILGHVADANAAADGARAAIWRLETREDFEKRGLA